MSEALCPKLNLQCDHSFVELKKGGYLKQMVLKIVNLQEEELNQRMEQQSQTMRELKQTQTKKLMRIHKVMSVV